VSVSLVSGHERLTGPRLAGPEMSLEQLVRPFGIGKRGITFVGDGARTVLSYQQIAQRSATAAARLRRLGVGAGDVVAMTVANDVSSVVAALAVWASGATLASLPPARRQSDWYASQFGQVLATMGCAFLVEPDGAALPIAPAAAFRRIPILALTAPGERPAGGPDPVVAPTALVQFTSGSVGTPKGVAVSGAKLAGHLAALATSLEVDSAADRFGSWLPLYHDLGFVGMFLLALAARADLVLGRPAVFTRQPATWLTMLAAERATITAAPDFAYRLAAALPCADGLDLSGMRVAISGGERVNWRSLLEFHRTTAPTGLRWEALTPSYGLAEGVLGVSRTPLGRGPRQGPGGLVSVGTAVAGARLRVPAGVAPGPLELGGDWVFDGYHTEDGFAATVGDWHDTGDAGLVHDGELYVLGRRDETVTSAGRNLFAEDVESVAHWAVGEVVCGCAAFRSPVDPNRFGLVVEVNPRTVGDADAAGELARRIRTAVTEALGTRLTPVLVTRVGAIPRTTSGKVRRARCRELYEHGALDRLTIALV
jgi:acyl-CoA synthetase (AMP-forming)/AMP-acid ligase II